MGAILKFTRKIIKPVLHELGSISYIVTLIFIGYVVGFDQTSIDQYHLVKQSIPYFLFGSVLFRALSYGDHAYEPCPGCAGCKVRYTCACPLGE